MQTTAQSFFPLSGGSGKFVQVKTVFEEEHSPKPPSASSTFFASKKTGQMVLTSANYFSVKLTLHEARI